MFSPGKPEKPLKVEHSWKTGVSSPSDQPTRGIDEKQPFLRGQFQDSRGKFASWSLSDLSSLLETILRPPAEVRTVSFLSVLRSSSPLSFLALNFIRTYSINRVLSQERKPFFPTPYGVSTLFHPSSINLTRRIRVSRRTNSAASELANEFDDGFFGEY